MEPPPKRARLSPPKGLDASEPDPDLEFYKQRAENDLRLKSTFEAIFEKYGKDFSGIGDEIDLETGEIVVDNGHLSEMRDEQDVGEDAIEEEDVGRFLRALTEVPELGYTDSDIEIDIQEQETPEEEEFVQENGSSGVVRLNFTPVKSSKPSFPSEAAILEQFGKDVRPQVVRYASQLRSLNTSTVEPAWQTPGQLPPTAGPRPILRSVLQPKRIRSVSPEGQVSIWAPEPPRRPPGRPRGSGLASRIAAVQSDNKRVRQQTGPIIISDDEEDIEDSGYISPRSEGQSLHREPRLRVSVLPSLRSRWDASLPLRRDKPVSSEQPPLRKHDNTVSAVDNAKSFVAQNVSLPRLQEKLSGALTAIPGKVSLRSLWDHLFVRGSTPTPVQLVEHNNTSKLYQDQNISTPYKSLGDRRKELFFPPVGERSQRRPQDTKRNQIESVDQKCSSMSRCGVACPHEFIVAVPTRDRSVEHDSDGLPVSSPYKVLEEEEDYQMDEMGWRFQEEKDSEYEDDPSQDNSDHEERIAHNKSRPMEDGTHNAGAGSEITVVDPMKGILPSEEAILKQFGKEVGPQVFQYIKQLLPASNANGSSELPSRQRQEGKPPNTVQPMQAIINAFISFDPPSQNPRPLALPKTASRPDGASPPNDTLNRTKRETIAVGWTPPVTGTKRLMSLVDDGTRPRYPHRILCGTAVLLSPSKRLTISQVRAWYMRTFSFFEKYTGWEPAVHSALKPCNGFYHTRGNQKNPGVKGLGWAVIPGLEDTFLIDEGRNKSCLPPHYNDPLPLRCEQEDPYRITRNVYRPKPLPSAQDDEPQLDNVEDWPTAKSFAPNSARRRKKANRTTRSGAEGAPIENQDTGSDRQSKEDQPEVTADVPPSADSGGKVDGKGLDEIAVDAQAPNGSDENNPDQREPVPDMPTLSNPVGEIGGASITVPTAKTTEDQSSTSNEKGDKQEPQLVPDVSPPAVSSGEVNGPATDKTPDATINAEDSNNELTARTAMPWNSGNYSKTPAMDDPGTASNDTVHGDAVNEETPKNGEVETQDSANGANKGTKGSAKERPRGGYPIPMKSILRQLRSDSSLFPMDGFSNTAGSDSRSRRTRRLAELVESSSDEVEGDNSTKGTPLRKRRRHRDNRKYQ